LPPAKTAHMSGRCTWCTGFGCIMEGRPAVEAVAAMEPGEMVAGATKSETAEGIAKAVIGPIIVVWRGLAIFTAARRDTVMFQGQGITGRADRDRSDRGRRRSAEHGRRREGYCQ